jgi:hypothetical protein
MVASGHQQGGSGVRADAVQRHEPGRVGSDQRHDELVQAVDLGL